MNNKLSILLILIIFVPGISVAQFAHLKHIVKPRFELGILIENTVLFNSRTTRKIIGTANYKEIILKGNSSNFYPYGFYLSGRLRVIGNLSIEFRPGIIFAGEPYAGLEYGFFLRYKFLKQRLFVVGGVNMHDNFGAGHNSLSSTSETITEIGGSIGYRFTKSFAAMLSFYRPAERIEYYTEAFDNYTAWNSYKLNYIIKFGFDLTFNW